MKRIHIILTIFICIITLQFTVLQVHAYTEEEKQAAKAWLSANGYAPTMAGAEQAYQDYLDGKFDDNGSRVPQTEPVTEAPTDAQTEPHDQSGNGQTSDGSNKNKQNDPKKPKKEKSDSDANQETNKADDPPITAESIIKTFMEESGTSESETIAAGETADTRESETETESETDNAAKTSKETPESKLEKQRKTATSSAFAETAPIIIGPIVVIIIGIIVILIKKSKLRRRS